MLLCLFEVFHLSVQSPEICVHIATPRRTLKVRFPFTNHGLVIPRQHGDPPALYSIHCQRARLRKTHPCPTLERVGNRLRSATQRTVQCETPILIARVRLRKQTSFTRRPSCSSSVGALVLCERSPSSLNL